MGFKFITIRSLIWFATTSIYFQVDVELEKKDSFIVVYTVWLEIKMWYKSWTSEVATIVTILIYPGLIALILFRLSPPKGFDGTLLDFGCTKRSELREHGAIILDTLFTQAPVLDTLTC